MEVSMEGRSAGETRMLKIIGAVIETIKEQGSEGAPSGIIYAALMGHGVTYEQYMDLIDALKRVGKVRETAHVLYWVG